LKTKHIIIYTFQSLEDPLVKGLILEYLKKNNDGENKMAFHLITHEQKEFSIEQKEVEKRRADLAKYNIEWYPVKYLSGSFILFKKAYNFIQTFFITRKIKTKYNPVAIVGFLSIAGGFSYVLSKLFRLKLIVYCFEPHSNYMIDFNIWKPSSLNYKLLKKFELLQIKHADHIVVPNHHTEKLVEKYRSSTGVYVCPISINTDAMIFDAEARNKIRTNLNANEKTVIIYTGKFGGIYYSCDEVIKFFSRLYTENSNLFFYIITPNIEEIKTNIFKHKLPDHSFHLSLTVPYNELNQHISAADIGFVALPSLPSQIYRTPVKTAIYLSCGLPYIVNKNIAEDDTIALENNIGVVIENLNEDPEKVNEKINSLLKNDLSQLHQRCRTIAVNSRSIDAANAVLNKIFSQL
jgi:glycosyltransferase involved in cell wall biosynthesis